jgi:hypothetical protein
MLFREHIQDTTKSNYNSRFQIVDIDYQDYSFLHLLSHYKQVVTVMLMHFSNESTTGMDIKLGADIREGIYGPVKLALNETGLLVAAETITITNSSDLASLLLRLQLIDKFIDKDYPHIVQYYGHQKIDEEVYILSEYIPGGTLQDFVIKFEHIGLTLASTLVAQILVGLEQLQKQDHAVTFLSLNRIF